LIFSSRCIRPLRTPPLFPYTTLFRSGKAPSRSGVSLAAITIEAPDLPEDVLGLFDPLLDLAGTYGDPSAGDPIQVRPACHRARPGRRGDGRLQPRPCCCSVPTTRRRLAGGGDRGGTARLGGALLASALCPRK